MKGPTVKISLDDLARAGGSEDKIIDAKYYLITSFP
jgi:hypothetical protein